MTKPPKPKTSAVEVPLKQQTRFVRWMVHVLQNEPGIAEFGPIPDMNGRIVTFHGKAGEAQLKAIVNGKDVALYRWKRGLDLELRTALGQQGLTQKCGVLSSDATVIAELDAADMTPAEDAEGEPNSVFAVTLGRMEDGVDTRRRR